MTPAHVLRNTVSESTVICHIQIKVIPILCVVLSNCLKGVWGGGGKALRCNLLLKVGEV